MSEIGRQIYEREQATECDNVYTTCTFFLSEYVAESDNIYTLLLCGEDIQWLIHFVNEICVNEIYSK